MSAMRNRSALACITAALGVIFSPVPAAQISAPASGRAATIASSSAPALRQWDTVTQSMLRSGDLLIESGGERGQQAFSNIRRPANVRNEIYRQMEAAQARDHDRIAGRRELSIPEQLEKLDDLRTRGVISQAEFDAKKTQLLDRM